MTARRLLTAKTTGGEQELPLPAPYSKLEMCIVGNKSPFMPLFSIVGSYLRFWRTFITLIIIETSNTLVVSMFQLTFTNGSN